MVEKTEKDRDEYNRILLAEEPNLVIVEPLCNG